MEESLIDIEVPLALICCALYTLIGLGIHHYKDSHDGKAPWLHESSLACVFGILIGGYVKKYMHEEIEFNGTLFFYLVLPPIIFSAGYSLKRKRFFQYIHQIAFFGIFGTILNFLCIACGTYFYGTYVGIKDIELDWHESFMFSSVLAGSDEVSAMSLVRISEFPRMGAMIFGEGVINDALSIVLFKTFLPIHNKNMNGELVEESTIIAGCLKIMSCIFYQLVMSCIIGVTCGLMNAKLLKSLSFTKHHPIHQTSLILLSGYIAYAIAEAFDISGILTLFIVAVVLAHYSWHSLSVAAQIGTRVSFAGMSDIAEGFAFSYVGLSIWGFTSGDIDFQFALYMLVVTIASRIFSIIILFMICKLLNWNSFNFPIAEQFGFALGGVVRGSLCWAQILQVKHAPVLVSSTLVIVLSTTIASGFLMPIIMPKLLNTLEENDVKEAQMEKIIPFVGINNDIEQAKTATSKALGFGETVKSNASVQILMDTDINKQNKHPTPRPISFTYQQGTKPHESKHVTFRSMRDEPICENPEETLSETAETHSQELETDAHQTQPFSVAPDSLSALTSIPRKPGRMRLKDTGANTRSILFIQWVWFDENIMKPNFGGSAPDHSRAKLLDETSKLNLCTIIWPSEVRKAILNFRDRKSMRMRRRGRKSGRASEIQMSVLSPMSMVNYDLDHEENDYGDEDDDGDSGRFGEDHSILSPESAIIMDIDHFEMYRSNTRETPKPSKQNNWFTNWWGGDNSENRPERFSVTDSYKESDEELRRALLLMSKNFPSDKEEIPVDETGSFSAENNKNYGSTKSGYSSFGKHSASKNSEQQSGRGS